MLDYEGGKRDLERIKQSVAEIKPLLVNVVLVIGGGGEYRTAEAEG